MAAQRTSVVTGANTGIGLVTARELARRGDRVIIACRSTEKAQAAIHHIAAATGSDDLEHVALDLADLDAVRASAATLVERGQPIDVLVANAGLAGQRGQTAQGIELAFGTNHLGHFLFATSLLPLLRAAPQPARVVVVSSDSHYAAKDGIPWDELRRPTKSVTGLPEYGVSKLANVLFAQELHRREPELFVGALHPGVIASDVWRRIPWPIRPIMTRFMKSTEDGAETSLLLATSDEVLDHNGAFWSEGKLKDPNPIATPELAAELWARSEAWTAPA
ncbi:MAG: SDR family oxidoreductase [Acidimicrobiales bacterium]|nr:SDR family oxidoreductase [Acidimicrobiales bacterium]